MSNSFGTYIVTLPARTSESADTVIILKLDGPPKAEPVTLTQGTDSPIVMDYSTAVTSGKAMKRFNRDGGFHIAKWMGPADSSQWHLLISQTGTYHFRIRYAAEVESKGSRYQIRVGDQTVNGIVEATGEGYRYNTFELTMISLKAGRYVVSLAPSIQLNHNLMFLHSLELVPDGPIMID